MDQIREWLIDYIDGNLPEKQRQAVEEKIREDGSLRKEYAQLQKVMQLMQNSSLLPPDEQLSQAFDKMLEEEMHKSQTMLPEKQGISIRLYWQVAAVIALVVVSAVIGIFIGRQGSKENSSYALTEEINPPREQVLKAIQNPALASQRLSGILASQTLASPDPEVLDALIKVMNQDDNTNVRLAALHALVRYPDDPEVKKALLQSLTSQSDPIVQVYLIDAVVQLYDGSAREGLEKIIEEDKLPAMVRDEAHVGLFKIL